MPDAKRLALWGGAAALVLLTLWVVAKSVLPFAIGTICGAAAVKLWQR